MGSSSYITNLDGAVVQHIEYIPFGEVFLEERNNSWNSPYLFNAKELDEETGLYYYGARYYNPRESVWLSVDPLTKKYPNVSPYAYTFQNPVKYIDPTGMEGEDWIKKGGKIFYDPSANKSNYKEKYGEDAERVGTLNGYTGNKLDYSYNFHSDGSYTFNTFGGIYSTTKSIYDTETITTEGGTIIEGRKCTTCPTISAAMATNSPGYQMGNPSGQLGVAAFYGIQTFGGIVAGEFVLGVAGLGGGISLSGSAVAGDALGGLGVQTSFSSSGVSMAEAFNSIIPSNFIYMGALSKGEGFRFADPATRGSHQILLEYGNPKSLDPLHSGSYMKINIGGDHIERIPLRGNPILNVGR